jgi:hypothetical protein
MIPNDIKAVADQLVQLENMVPLLKEASAQMGLMRKKVKFLEAGATDIMGPELPKSLSPIVPLINAYYEDREGWFEFIRYLRDTGPWPDTSITWKKLQDLMRTENSNACQYRRRNYSSLAADLKEAKEGKFEKGGRSAYMTALQKLWTAQLAQKQSVAWANSGKKNLPMDERVEVSNQFWNSIEEQINAGKYPDPRVVMDEL